MGEPRPGDTFDMSGDFRGAYVYIKSSIEGGPARRIPLHRPPRAQHFTDRKEELDALLAALRPGQVVTLCGPGGIGKTALAAEAVWTLAPGSELPALFPDGIIFHSFYNQPQAALALEAIALALGEELRPTPRDAAQRALASRQVLLLLDGAEDADDLSAVLGVAGGCGVLVTSRARRDAVAARQDIHPLVIDEAVALLQKWGEEQAADAASVEQICQRVGRLPLAVRLAGRYLAETGEKAGEYLAWLQQTPLEALDQGRRRQESVPVLLQKSLGQVSEAACQVLGVVGLLALVPFERAVLAAALNRPENDLRKPLGELVNYGLMLCGDGVYEVAHALIHIYARERVEPEAETVRRLAAHYAIFARELGEQGLAGYARLDREREHILRVLAACVELEEWEAARGLAWAIEDYLDVQGHLASRIIVNQTGLDVARQLGNRREESGWLGNLGLVYGDLGQVEQGIDYLKQAQIINREIGYRQGEASDLGNLGLVYHALGQVEQAIGYHRQALVIHREIGYRQGEASDLGNLGLAYHALGQVEQAIDYLKQALVIHREIGYRQGEASDLGNLGLAYHALGQVEQAIDYYQAALVIHREIGYRQGEANQLGNLGLAYRALGQVEQAIDYHQQALVIHREIGYRQGEANQLGNLGLAYCDLGQIEQAIDYLKQALVIHRGIGYRQGEANQLGNLGLVYRDLGQVEQAIDYHQQALAIDRKIGYRQGEASDLGNLGLVYSDLGQVEQAIDYLKQALVIDREIGYRQGEANQLGNLGLIYSALGQVEQAIDYYQQALSIHREIGYRQGEANQLGNLGLVYRDLGQVEQAIDYYQQALVIHREIGYRQGEASALGNLGLVYSDLGQVEMDEDHPGAIEYLEQALRIFEEIKSSHANQVRQQLVELHAQAKMSPDGKIP